MITNRNILWFALVGLLFLAAVTIYALSHADASFGLSGPPGL